MATKRSIKRRPINDDSTDDSAEGEQPLIMTLNDVRLRHSHVIPHLIQDFCTMSDKSSASIEHYPIDDRSKSETSQHASKSELKHLERVLLSDQELLQLQQLIAYHNHQSEQHVNETERNISNTNKINNENNEQNSMVDQRCENKNQAINNKKKQSSGGGDSTRRPHMENDIDPLWYLANGPLIIFPPEQLSRLTMNDMVDYYRAYPTMNWSKYPRLYEQIVQNLTERERSDLQLMDEQYRKQNQLKRKIYRFYVRFLRHFDFYKLVKWLFTFITRIGR